MANLKTTNNNLLFGYEFERKHTMTHEELSENYEFELPLYRILFNEIPEGLKEKFIGIRSKLFNDPNYFNYKITKQNETCGYISFILFNGQLHLYDIVLNDKYKRSKLLLSILNFVLNEEELKGFNEIHFAVDVRNEISMKTWIHLGATKEIEHDKKPGFVITRQAVEKYLKRVCR